MFTQFKKYLFLLLAVFILFVPSFALTQQILISDHDKIKISIKAYPFALTQVRLLDGPFKRAMERDMKYLLDLESDRLLHMFRVTAGLPSDAEPLGGWESPGTELRGHFMGHYLSACAMMYAATWNIEIKDKADAIVSELAKCQEALGNGYLSAYPEEFIDRVEATERVWAPYYTLHKIFAGLLDMYVHCDNRQALSVAEKMADWVKMRTDRLSEEHMQRMLNHTEQGGMNEVLANLYAVTGNPDHLALSFRFNQKSYNEPLTDYKDKLKGLHVNSIIPNIVGTARQYELTGDRYYHDVADFFWEQITRARSFSTGGTSHDEHWGSDPYQLDAQLSPTTQETCCTYNMLRLTRHLFCWYADPKYADYYERALFNGILPTQNPEDGMMMYYVSLGSGFYKTFNTPRNSFWCCTGTGVENYAKTGNSIYYHTNDGLYVNLFIASELNWKDKVVTIRQETNFPEEEGTTLVIGTEKPVEFTLHLRIPYWTEDARVIINGESLQESASPGSYLEIKRTWNGGDKIEVTLPMSLHLHRMPNNPNRASILYGPLVLAGELGTKNLTKEDRYGHYGPVKEPLPSSYFVVKDKNLNTWIKPIEEKPLTFKTINAGRPDDVSLIPFYKLFGQRYAVYWDVYAESEWKKYEKYGENLLAGIIDAVKIGDEVSDEEHHFLGYGVTNGEEMGSTWVSTRDWFRYNMKVLPAHPVILHCTFLEGDPGREYDISIDYIKIDTEPVKTEVEEGFSILTYALPADLTVGKKRVNVIFRARRGERRGPAKKLFGCAVLKPEE